MFAKVYVASGFQLSEEDIRVLAGNVTVNGYEYMRKREKKQVDICYETVGEAIRLTKVVFGLYII